MKSTIREDSTAPVVGLIASTKKAANARGDLTAISDVAPVPSRGMVVSELGPLRMCRRVVHRLLFSHSTAC